MKVDVRVDINPAAIAESRGFGQGGKLQRTLDSEIVRRCEPYVPKDLSTLIKSGVANTQIGTGKIIWDTPYARRWYYQPAKFQGAPTRGNHWFERMWDQGGREAILQTLAKEAGGRTG